jgi:hypothetical protein
MCYLHERQLNDLEMCLGHPEVLVYYVICFELVNVEQRICIDGAYTIYLLF